MNPIVVGNKVIAITNHTSSVSTRCNLTMCLLSLIIQITITFQGIKTIQIVVLVFKS